MKYSIYFLYIYFFSVTGIYAMAGSDKPLSESDQARLRLGDVTSQSCALVRTKSCSFTKDPRKEDNALLERVTSPRGSKSGSCSPRVTIRERAASVSTSSNAEQPPMMLFVATSK